MPKFSARPKSLKVSDFNYYLADEVQLELYKKINVSGSLEDQVDAFYIALFPDIFKKKQGFSITAQLRVTSSGQRTDLSVRVLNNHDFKRVIICESKRREFESHSSVWADALQQAVDYAVSNREEAGRLRKSMYLTVNIGTYIRFYELRHNAYQAIDWAPAGTECYELADDEADVWRLFHELRDTVLS
ncbi:hypothetical protein NLG97_g1751 [Lecanicillium saksenae]|uniref:Uncharacterized protein n=1 Tax=Lecanicillium saksenae TaxID=468837 RepID=A0ACC1R2V4_9HYPO|nr:hypothetical protein NLG97_g1751 [Lecanicillium saksenae]